MKGEKRLITYQEWSDLIQGNFEKCYYIPLGMQVHGECLLGSDNTNQIVLPIKTIESIRVWSIDVEFTRTCTDLAKDANGLTTNSDATFRSR